MMPAARLRPLIIDDTAKAKVTAVIEHASKHHFFPNRSPTPGNDPRFVAKLGSYRAVFTFTHADGLLWRHLSVSVPGPHYPHPAAVFTIAQEFGFSGWDGRSTDKFPDGWIGQLNEAEHAILVAQPMKPEVPETTVH